MGRGERSSPMGQIVVELYEVSLEIGYGGGQGAVMHGWLRALSDASDDNAAFYRRDTHGQDYIADNEHHIMPQGP